ncbi:MAG: pyridoxamine 5'-phosphate oxidase family protein [Saprospiraceae bacterium]|nr:pyridoxamine 5'-phosphate oxidase family protein [Saprospiraceae bacterium]
MKTKTSRTQGSRYYPKRYDAHPAGRDAILDEGLVCHVAFTLEQQPFILPTGYCRVGDTLYLHGSVGSHFFMQIAKGIPVCVSVTLLDGLVFARSVFNHSMNYRSVVAFGRTRLVEDETERWMAAEKFTEHVAPGRWNDARKPDASDMKKTMFIAVEIEEASVKFRAHGASDDPEDMGLPVWAGVLPLQLSPLAPETDESGVPDLPLPDYIQHYQRKASYRPA